MYSILYNRDIWTAIVVIFDVDECVGEWALKRICPQENKTFHGKTCHTGRKRLADFQRFKQNVKVGCEDVGVLRVFQPTVPLERHGWGKNH